MERIAPDHYHRSEFEAEAHAATFDPQFALMSAVVVVAGTLQVLWIVHNFF